MQKKDVPQDLGALGKISKEISYATDDEGKYVTEKSIGWDVKKAALDATWSDIEKRIAIAKQKVLNNEASPILFFMEKNLMDIPTLAAYTNFAKWKVKRHLKPSSYKKLSDEKLQLYANAFNISVGDLKTMNPHEG